MSTSIERSCWCCVMIVICRCYWCWCCFHRSCSLCFFAIWWKQTEYPYGLFAISLRQNKQRIESPEKLYNDSHQHQSTQSNTQCKHARRVLLLFLHRFLRAPAMSIRIACSWYGTLVIICNVSRSIHTTQIQQSTRLYLHLTNSRGHSIWNNSEAIK